tara:strand:+ start:153035 stop:153388 length:354 start_codon:yes stop_codon:yes gene_type:complete
MNESVDTLAVRRRRVNKVVTFPTRLAGWFGPLMPAFMRRMFKSLDRRVDGAISFFFRHYGKTKFMIAMSKKAQVMGLEELFLSGPKAFLYFFLYYLVRDTILYIIIPIMFANLTSGI